MRHILAVIVFACTLIGVAFAREAQTGPAPVENIAPQASATELALQDVYTALFFDTGLYERVMTPLLPSLRETALNSAFYRIATPHHRIALDAVIDQMPALMREEVVNEIT